MRSARCELFTASMSNMQHRLNTTISSSEHLCVEIWRRTFSLLRCPGQQMRLSKMGALGALKSASLIAFRRALK